MNNHFGKIITVIVTGVIVATLGILWKMPFQNAKALDAQGNRITCLETQEIERWDRIQETLQRIERKVDKINGD